MAQAQSLKRTLGPVAVALLTLSVLSPAASVFITGADVVHQVGTGAALAFGIGGVLTLVFTFAQAELGASFPFAGGDYAMIGQVLGPRWGFVQFGLDLLSTPVFIALTASGIALYLQGVVPGLRPIPTAIGAIALATAGAIVNVRTSAVVTGVFLGIELAALALVTLLGLADPARGIGEVLTAPVAFTGGIAAPLTLGIAAGAVSAASWAVSGAGQAIYFAEELHDPVRVGRLVVQITGISMGAIVLPVLALAVGSRDLPVTLAADSPFAAFIAQHASPALATAIGLGIAAAIFNAVMAAVICYGRWLWSSGRDAIWAAPVNRALVRLHPRYGSPWVATLAVGGAAAGFTLLGLRLLVLLAAANGIVNWALLNVGGWVGRRRGLTGQGAAYRAPLFPLTNIVSLVAVAALAVLTWQDDVGRTGELIIAADILVALAYHRFVLCRRPGGWRMVGPAPAYAAPPVTPQTSPVR